MITAPRLQHLSSGGLAVAIHGLFLAALVWSMSWKNPPAQPVEAELWSALPLPSREPVVPEPPPLVPPAPEVPTALEVADIALREARKDAPEQKRQAEAELRQQEEQRAREKQRAQEETRRQEEARQAEELARREREEQAERARIEQLRQELRRRQLEQEMARQAQVDLENEAIQLRARREQALRRDQQVEDFRRRIQAKILSYVNLPQNLGGNPEAVFQVTLLGNGEVREARLLQSSGQPAYDLEVERAILRASPLPLPNDKAAAAAFRSGLILKFRPQ
ncbi:MAG TPA: TonB family protein [Thiobacillaceae bacterium]|nr:TonB family protein [Thiobacillaceae bacterium]HNU64390.1 TonB family protein [Thiobacillaceae bacterium]